MLKRHRSRSEAGMIWRRRRALDDLDEDIREHLCGQRTCDHAIREFVGWYCSEPRLAFNRTGVPAAKLDQIQFLLG
jgi:hypothetical protein